MDRRRRPTIAPPDYPCHHEVEAVVVDDTTMIVVAAAAAAADMTAGDHLHPNEEAVVVTMIIAEGVVATTIIVVGMVAMAVRVAVATMTAAAGGDRR